MSNASHRPSVSQTHNMTNVSEWPFADVVNQSLWCAWMHVYTKNGKCGFGYRERVFGIPCYTANQFHFRSLYVRKHTFPLFPLIDALENLRRIRYAIHHFIYIFLKLKKKTNILKIWNTLNYFILLSRIYLFTAQT